MAQIVYTEAVGSGADWTMVKPNAQVFNYIAQAAQNAMTYLTDNTKDMLQNVDAVFQRVNYSDAVRKARAALRQLSNRSRTNEVVELIDIGAIQNASPVMQRFIMADPLLRGLYHEEGCSGYAGSYVDYNPGVSGIDHYDYRRVMNGMWYEDKDSGNMRVDTFYEETEGDVDLDPLAQMDILRTWDFVRARIKAGKEDPTSPDNEML